MLNNSQAARIDPRLLPDDESAVCQFEANGVQLTVFSCFGEDPLQGNILLVAQRETEFHRRFPDFSDFFIQLLMVIIPYFVRVLYVL